MAEYAVTFGQQYRNDPHPRVKYAHPDGWLTIKASDEVEAREKAFAHLGINWAFLYPMEEFKKDYFPLGELHVI